MTIDAARAAHDAARDWQAVRGDPSIQFAPTPVPPPAETPEWLKTLGRLLEQVLAPIGKALGLNAGPVLWGLAAVAGLAAVWIGWRLAEPLLERGRRRAAEPADFAWTPGRDAAQALLDEADRLAAAGQFAMATHLLLQRSVGQIAAARPGWVHPASTAREIAALALLPEPARRAFAVIAQRVERSLFALRALDRDDWQAARGAYADFALARLEQEGSR